ncbi:hypothetical protein [Frankia sp. AvcI1]|uniref:hypothetical protein n=1 Tax=Frankia sp. AvcI1 TaxID=573496 RepID=UPI002118D380|nr:hypothetical protein [Frankia sp. AvcI1]
MTATHRALAQIAALLVIAAAAFGLAHTAPALYAPAATTITATAPVIDEDSPLWDCHTMGNRICGPAVAPAASVVPVCPVGTVALANGDHKLGGLLPGDADTCLFNGVEINR